MTITTILAASIAVFGIRRADRKAAAAPPELLQTAPTTRSRASSARRGCGFFHLDHKRPPGHGGPASCSGG